MKTNKTTLRMETLEDRNMLSASPLGEIVVPEPPASNHSSGGAAGGIVSEGQGYGVFSVAETETSRADDAHKETIEIASWSFGESNSYLTVKMKDLLVSGVQGDEPAAFFVNIHDGAFRTAEEATESAEPMPQTREHILLAVAEESVAAVRTGRHIIYS